MSSRMISEFFGTFILVTAILFTGNPVYIAAGFLAAITITGALSGGHINPAVSLAMLFKGDMNTSSVVQYISAQVLGALAAVAVFKMLKSPARA